MNPNLARATQSRAQIFSDGQKREMLVRGSSVLTRIPPNAHHTKNRLYIYKYDVPLFDITVTELPTKPARRHPIPVGLWRWCVVQKNGAGHVLMGLAGNRHRSLWTHDDARSAHHRSRTTKLYKKGSRQR